MEVNKYIIITANFFLYCHGAESVKSICLQGGLKVDEQPFFRPYRLTRVETYSGLRAFLVSRGIAHARGFGPHA
jgi:hypothetical protein